MENAPFQKEGNKKGKKKKKKNQEIYLLQSTVQNKGLLSGDNFPNPHTVGCLYILSFAIHI